jgi:hypothetical protein
MQSISMAQTLINPAASLVNDESRLKSISLITHLYVWSIVLEPLLFFVLFERTISGVTSNLGRLIQIAVVILLAAKYFLGFLNSGKFTIRIPNFSHLRYFNYGVYFSLAVLAGVIGALAGAYNIPQPYPYNEGESEFSRFLNSESVRPLIEYLITIYYFAYFVVLPQYLLRTEKSLRYFFSVFTAVFIISFAAGAIELILDSNLYFIPRHFADGRYVGWRFHGLAGEPRDAFVYLFFGLAMLHLKAYFNNRSLSKWWVPTIIGAALLTQSASGLLGGIFFLGMYSIYSLRKFSMRRTLRLLALSAFIIVLLYIAIIQSERIMQYLASASNLWTILETGAEIPYLMAVQIENIYPLYDLIIKLRDLNVLPVLFGSGLGSASAINHMYDPTIGAMTNPYSQLVRVMYESGLVGTFFYIMSFAYPVVYYTKSLPAKKQHAFLLLTLLLLGCSFAHRSATSFIYLGIFISVFCVLIKRNRQKDDPAIQLPSTGIGSVTPLVQTN